MGFKNILNKLRSLRKGSEKRFDVRQETANIINENQDFVRSLLLSQMMRGVDADEKAFELIRPNGDVFPFYSDRTVFEKESLGLQTDVIQYKHTGLFHETLYVFASQHSFIFDSEVPYLEDILIDAVAHERIIELSKANLLRLRNELIMPQLKIRYDNYRGYV